MKKAAIILLICVYSLATMGFSLKQFYCCGKLKSVTFSLLQEAKDKCGNGDDKTGCCDSKFQFFKVKDNHISADQADFPFKHFIDLHLYTPSFQDKIKQTLIATLLIKTLSLKRKPLSRCIITTPN